MLNLLRMDMRRMCRSKMFFIAFLSLAAGILLSLVTFRLVTDSELRAQTLGEDLSFTQEQESSAEALLELTDIQALCTTVYSGSFFFVALYIVVTLFVTSDYRSGFAKNIFSLNGSRWKYYLSKLLCSAAVCAVWIMGSYVTFHLSGLVCGLRFQAAPPSDLLLFFLTYLAVGIGFSAQSIFVSAATRSEGAGIGIGIIMAGGLTVVLVDAFLGNFQLSIMKFTLYGAVQEITQYFAARSSLVHSMTVTGIWVVIWSALSLLALYKKDV